MLITTYLQLWERGPTGSSGFPAGWDGLRTGSGGFPIPRKQVPMRSEFTKKSRLEPAFEGILEELPHDGITDFIEESPHGDTTNVIGESSYGGTANFFEESPQGVTAN